MADADLKRRNRRILFGGAFVAAAMVGAAYAAVPLYDLFCKVTGYGGTTQRREVAAEIVLDREIAIRFDASIARGLPIKFSPVQREQRLNVGRNGLAFYKVENTSSEPISITATYNVTPFKAAPYFVKLECFCFTEQRLAPGEAVEMPVLFYVDPEIDEERRLGDVKTITLSYTFFEMEAGADAYEAAATEGRDALE